MRNRSLSLLLALSVTLPSTSAMGAPPVPEEFWTAEAKVTLARALVGEADWHKPDHAPIAHVLRKRWLIARRNLLPGIDFVDFMHKYSKPLTQKHARARRVQALPWGPLPGPFSKRWDRVRQFVERWGDGRVKDPCPKALNWGGTMDVPQAGWVPVNCGRTRNIFYAAAERRPVGKG